MGFGQYNISATSDPAGAFMKAMQMGQNISGNMLNVYNSAVQNRYKKKLIHAQTDAAEAAANARHIQNQYLPGMLAAKGKTEQLTDAQLRQKTAYPLLHAAGPLGQATGALFMAQHPGQYQLPQQQQQGLGASQQLPQQQTMQSPLQTASPQSQQPISTGNQLADMILNSANTKQKLAQARTKYYGKLGDTAGTRYLTGHQREQSSEALEKRGFSVPQIANMSDQQKQGIVDGNLFYDTKTGQITPGTSLPAPVSPLSQQESTGTGGVLAKQEYTGPQLQQVMTLNTALTSAQNIAPNLEDALKYFGARGQSNASFQKLKGLMGENVNDPDYQKYFNYIHGQLPIFVNEIRKGLGGQATDKEIEIMNKLANPSKYSTSPKTAVNYFKSLVDLLQSQKKIVRKSPGQQLTTDIDVYKNAPSLQGSSTNGTTRIIAPDGSVKNIPTSSLSDALKAGGKRYGG